MSIDPIVRFAGQADAWLRQQRARIEQRHLQSGQHCRLDLAGLLQRIARQSGAAAPAELVTGREDLATDLVRHSKVETAAQEVGWNVDDTAHAPVRSPSGVAVPTSPNGRRVRGPATLGDFVARNRPDAGAPREWIATLADLTTVVVSDRCDLPSAVHIDKAVSIVQSRAYLEPRARRLLLPFTKEDGSWRPVTIDLGVTARRHGCEFLMSFAFRATNGVLSITSSYVEIGFALDSSAAIDPIFVLAVVRAAGFSA
jgi:hypothetical protein